MTQTAKKLLDAVLELPAAERARVAETLLVSLDGEADDKIDAAWGREVERRTRELEEGRVKLISWARVKKQAARRLRAKV
jgi:putative addiction module component (TIGR02574 family)